MNENIYLHFNLCLHVCLCIINLIRFFSSLKISFILKKFINYWELELVKTGIYILVFSIESNYAERIVTSSLKPDY